MNASNAARKFLTKIVKSDCPKLTARSHSAFHASKQASKQWCNARPPKKATLAISIIITLGLSPSTHTITQHSTYTSHISHFGPMVFVTLPPHKTRTKTSFGPLLEDCKESFGHKVTAPSSNVSLKSMEIGWEEHIKESTAASLFETETDCFPCKETFETDQANLVQHGKERSKGVATDLWKILKIMVAAYGKGLK